MIKKGRIPKYIFTKKETQFLMKNYPIHGLLYCIDNTKLSRESICSFANTNKLRVVRNYITIDLNNKYFCYILGLIWADGCLEKNSNRISISLKQEDMDNLKYIFEKLTKWRLYYSCVKQSTRNNTPQLRLSTSDEVFKNFLIENDFLKKSKISACKILSKIPTVNVKYFFRGIIDGDGCFCHSSKQHIRYFSITSTIEQNWKYIETILKNINCKYIIRRAKYEKGSCSTVKVCGKEVIKVGEFIYDDFFGLERKRRKFLEIKQSYEKREKSEKEKEELFNNRSKGHFGKAIKSIICLETNIEYESIKMATKKLNITPSGVSAVLSGKQKTTGGYSFVYA